jgi:hypothetical protein
MKSVWILRGEASFERFERLNKSRGTGRIRGTHGTCQAAYQEIAGYGFGNGDWEENSRLDGSGDGDAYE